MPPFKFVARRIHIIDRIIIAVAIQIQAVNSFGIQVGGIVGRDESTPFGAVISGVAVVQAGVAVVVIASVTDGVGVGNVVISGFAGNSAVAPGVVQILGHHIAAGIINRYNITQQIPLDAPAIAFYHFLLFWSTKK